MDVELDFSYLRHSFMHILKKLWSNKWVFRSIFSTLFFNFHFLPFKQAIYLPIWLYKPRFGKLSGNVIIDETLGGVRPGMIRMGFHNVGIYPNNGIYLDIIGSITFEGTALIGNDCYIGVGEKSSVIFGEDFRATTTFRLTSQCGISFGKHVRFGWDCLVMDTDYHMLKRKDGTFTKGYENVRIGSYNWFGNGCRIMKGANTPDYVSIAAGTWITKPVEVPEYSVVGNEKTVKIIAKDLWLDPNQCDIL